MIEGRMRADGRLDPAEKTRLNQMLNDSERDILAAPIVTADLAGINENW